MSSLFSSLGGVSLTSSFFAAGIILLVGYGVHVIADLPVLGFLVKWLNPLCIYDAINGQSGKCGSDKGYMIVTATYGLIVAGIVFMPALESFLPMISLIIAAIVSFITMAIVRQSFPKTTEQMTVVVSLVLGCFTVPVMILAYRTFVPDPWEYQRSFARRSRRGRRFGPQGGLRFESRPFGSTVQEMQF